MKRLTFYLDFISPYAYLVFEKLPQVLEGLSYSVEYRPVFLGALLRHNESKGPAEIPYKRNWIYRHVLWLAHDLGIDLKMPKVHPFSALPLLRLAIAAGEQGQINRHVCEKLMRHVWVGGEDALNPARMEALAKEISPQRDPSGDSVKAELKSNTDVAFAKEIFGVPTIEVDGKTFFGLDSLPMLRAYLAGDNWFDADHWQVPEQIINGLRKP